MSLPSHPLLPQIDCAQEDNAPVFQAPWEAKAFAIVNQLAVAQAYSWSEWTEQFAAEISAGETGAVNTDLYYEHWVQACEKLLIAKGILDHQSIEQRIKSLLIEREANEDHHHQDQDHTHR